MCISDHRSCVFDLKVNFSIIIGFPSSLASTTLTISITRYPSTREASYWSQWLYRQSAQRRCRPPISSREQACVARRKERSVLTRLGFALCKAVVTCDQLTTSGLYEQTYRFAAHRLLSVRVNTPPPVTRTTPTNLDHICNYTKEQRGKINMRTDLIWHLKHNHESLSIGGWWS